MKNNIVEEKDLIGRLKGFPIQIVQTMIDRQVEQGNVPDITIFQQNAFESKGDGGFTWGKTKEGSEFWLRVIYNESFDLFFLKYPIKRLNMKKERAKKLSARHYIYRGFPITGIYLSAEGKVCWEAEDKDGSGFAHSFRLKDTKSLIDEEIQNIIKK